LQIHNFKNKNKTTTTKKNLTKQKESLNKKKKYESFASLLMSLSRNKATSLDVASDAVCYLGRRRFSGLSFKHIVSLLNQICAYLSNLTL